MNKKAQKAVMKSIAHWEEDILAPLLEGDVIDENSWWLVWQHTKESVLCYDSDCPLCHCYQTKTCDRCPYKLKYGKKCDDDGEPWMAWIHEPTIENAIKMIRKLKGIPKEEREYKMRRAKVVNCKYRVRDGAPVKGCKHPTASSACICIDFLDECSRAKRRYTYKGNSAKGIASE